MQKKAVDVARIYDKVLSGAAKIAGWRLHAIGVRLVAALIFLLNPSRRRASLRFYRTLLPMAGHFAWWALSFRQFLQFSENYTERFRTLSSIPGKYRFEGADHLILEGKKKGGVIIMSHHGEWEMAARFFFRKGFPLMIFMGEQEQAAMEAENRIRLKDEGIRVMVVGKQDDGSLNLVEAVRFLEGGGYVAIAGDILWTKGQRTVRGRFCGHQVTIPAAPFALAYLSRTPLFYFFAFRVGWGDYRHTISPAEYISEGSEGNRELALSRGAQSYLNYLESLVYRFPTHWYHFEDFLGDPVDEASDRAEP